MSVAGSELRHFYLQTTSIGTGFPWAFPFFFLINPNWLLFFPFSFFFSSIFYVKGELPTTSDRGCQQPTTEHPGLSVPELFSLQILLHSSWNNFTWKQVWVRCLFVFATTCKQSVINHGHTWKLWPRPFSAWILPQFLQFHWYWVKRSIVGCFWGTLNPAAL